MNKRNLAEILATVKKLFSDAKKDPGEAEEMQLLRAHGFSNNHKPELERDGICGCFYCLEIFSPSEIEDWIIADNACDSRGTAICPYCGVDSVIGESSGFPVTKPFLKKMRIKWFG